jgi:hypothetical protein
LPVPTRRRERKRPAIVGGLDRERRRCRAAADEMHDFELIAVREADAVVSALRHDLEIALDRDLARIETELGQERGHGERAVEPMGLTVDLQLHAW